MKMVQSQPSKKRVTTEEIISDYTIPKLGTLVVSTSGLVSFVAQNPTIDVELYRNSTTWVEIKNAADFLAPVIVESKIALYNGTSTATCKVTVWRIT